MRRGRWRATKRKERSEVCAGAGRGGLGRWFLALLNDCSARGLVDRTFGGGGCCWWKKWKAAGGVGGGDGGLGGKEAQGGGVGHEGEAVEFGDGDHHAGNRD